MEPEIGCFVGYASMIDVVEIAGARAGAPGRGSPEESAGATPNTCIRLTAEDRRKIEDVRVRLGLKSMTGVIRYAVDVVYSAGGGK